MGAAQALPHAPQLAVSVLVLVSHPLVAVRSQSAKPLAHAPTTHAPEAQACVATLASAQTRPHDPQLFGSKLVEVQLPEHEVSPAPHVAVQAPAVHTRPAPHAVGALAVLHAPQLFESLAVLTSHPLAALPSQSAYPALQAPITHAPAAHVAAALAKRHTLPHAPQLFASVPRTLVSQPLLAVPSQSAKPALHPPTTHRLDEHALTLTLASEHRAPHAPQLAGSEAVLTQSPEQSVVPETQEVAQLPAVQTWPEAQVVAQVPQCALSPLTLVSHPFAGLPSQSANPAAHMPSVHAPATHDAPALAKRHATPHPPQLFTSAPRTLDSQPFAAVPSQSANPALHPPTTQRPDAHAFTLTLAREHAAPHAPQLFGSTCVLTQSPEQLVAPATHEVAHAPEEHT